MELLIALGLFFALIACWMVLPGSAAEASAIVHSADVQIVELGASGITQPV